MATSNGFLLYNLTQLLLSGMDNVVDRIECENGDSLVHLYRYIYIWYIKHYLRFILSIFIAKRIAGAKPPAKSGALMIEMWNLAFTNSFCRLTLLKALVSSLSVHVHLISCFRALWEIFLAFFLPKTCFIFYI